MKKLNLAAIIICAIIVILEILPYGAVLNFMTAPDDPIPYIRETYSYFNLTPFGYANFGPLLCAVLSVILLVMHVIFSFVKTKKGAYSSAIVLTVLAILFSITPLLMFGSGYYSAIGLMISALLIVLFAVTYHLQKKCK